MVEFRGVGQLLGAQAFTGGQLQGLAAGQQDAERRRQQEFLNFFRVQQAQQQAGQFQEQQAFRQQMFERQFGPEGLQERRFGLDVARTFAQTQQRERGLDIQEARLRGTFGQQPDIADLIGPRLTEEQARVNEIAQLRLQQRGALDAQPSVGQPPGFRAAAQPTIQPPAVPRRRRAAGLSRKDIIRLSVKAGEGDRAAALTLAGENIDAGIFGDVQTPSLVAGAKDKLKDLGINISQATQRQIQDALPKPIGFFRGEFEALKQQFLPFGVSTGVNFLRKQTGFTQPAIQEGLQELQTFLKEIRRAPREVRDVQDDDVRFAILFRDRLLQLQRRFARAEEFDVSLADLPVVGEGLALTGEGLGLAGEFIGERILEAFPSGLTAGRTLRPRQRISEVFNPFEQTRERRPLEVFNPFEQTRAVEAFNR